MPAGSIMLGCALDPLAELDVFVFALNGDFDAYRPRLARYVKGLEDDTIAAAVQRLQELYAEVARREGRLADLGAKKVTRQLAQDHRDLRPIVVLFSECHELFGHPEYGDIAAELATKTAKRARKTAITLIFDTQSARARKRSRRSWSSWSASTPASTSRAGGPTMASSATGASLPVSARPTCGPAVTAAPA